MISVIGDSQEQLFLIPTKVAPAICHGSTRKEFVKDTLTGALYLVKYPRRRTLADIFGDSIPVEFRANYGHLSYDQADQVHNNKDKGALKPYFEDMRDLDIEISFGEVVYSLVARALFPASLVTPKTYLHMNPKTQKPLVISEYIPEFN